MLSRGQLFYTLMGNDYACTANAVESLSRSVIATAAHCVQVRDRTLGAEQIKNFLFLLGYRQGPAVGRFPINRGFYIRDWYLNGLEGHDFAFLSASGDQKGFTVADVVKPSDVRFFAQRPLATPFAVYAYRGGIDNGAFLYKCSEAYAVLDQHQTSFPPVRIAPGCPNFTGGASGGPVMQSFSDGYFQTVNITYYKKNQRNPRNDGAVKFVYWGDDLSRDNSAYQAWNVAQHYE
ncbi:MAG TPA: trypsin-like serine peptidase [Xylella sp.]